MKTNGRSLSFNSVFTFPESFSHVIDLIDVVGIDLGELDSDLGSGAFGTAPDEFSLNGKTIETGEMHAEANAGFIGDLAHENQIHSAGGKVGENAGDLRHVVVIDHC
jgi:hypothetical protein